MLGYQKVGFKSEGCFIPCFCTGGLQVATMECKKVAVAVDGVISHGQSCAWAGPCISGMFELCMDKVSTIHNGERIETCYQWIQKVHLRKVKYKTSILIKCAAFDPLPSFSF